MEVRFFLVLWPKQNKAAAPKAVLDLKQGFPKQSLLAIALLLVALRSFALLWYGIEKVNFGDAPDYLEAARFICEKGAYPESGSVPFFRPPLYPAALSLVQACSGQNLFLAKALNVLSDLLSLTVLGVLAFGIFGAKGAALSMLLFALDPGLIYLSLEIRTEPLFTFLLLSSLSALFYSHRLVEGGKSRAFAILSAAFLSLSALTRPASLGLTPLYIYTLSKNRRNVFYFIFFAALTLAPWVLRNHLRYGEFIIVNDAMGYNLWRGSHPELFAASHKTQPEEFQEHMHRFETQISAQMDQVIRGKSQSPKERERLWISEFWKIVQAYPREVLSYTAFKTVNFWRLWLNPAAHSRKTVFISALWFLTLFAATISGMRHLYIRERKLFLWLIAYAAMITLMHVPFQTVMRFRIPFAEPIMLLISVYWILQRRYGDIVLFNSPASLKSKYVRGA